MYDKHDLGISSAFYCAKSFKIGQALRLDLSKAATRVYRFSLAPYYYLFSKDCVLDAPIYSVSVYMIPYIPISLLTTVST